MGASREFVVEKPGAKASIWATKTHIVMRPFRHLLIGCALAASAVMNAQTESEPNDNFGQANAIALAAAMNGDIGGAPCVSGSSDDYFVLNLVEDGHITISTNAANSGTGNSGLRVFVYNAGGSQIAYFDHATGPNGVPAAVSSTMTCLNKGTYYFRPERLNGGVCYTYALTITRAAPVFADDLEPNNNFGEAAANPLLPAGTPTEGHVNFLHNNPNNADYYRLQTSGDGRLNITINAEAPAAGSVRVYVYNGSGGQIDYFDAPVGTGGTPVSTTQSYPCYGQGIYYFMVTSLNACGVSYALSHTLSTPVYANDGEPNNSFPTSLPLAHNTYTEGHINFHHYGNNDDYYSITTPDEGTITVTMIAELAGASAGSIRTYLYNSGGGQLDYFDSPIGALGDDDTTVVSFTCYGQGAYFLRTVSVAGCGISYKVKYAITGAVYANDAEPNNNFGQAAANPLLAHNTFTQGHINFNHYGDNDDYYYISTPAEGTLRLTTIAERVPGPAGTVRVYVYNNSGGQINYYDASVGGSNDDDTTTVLFDCYGQGN